MTGMMCRSDPDLWFSGHPRDIQRAKALCEECPMSVYRNCRAEGWKHEHGVWGGLSAEDRARINPERFRVATFASRRDSKAADVKARLLPVARLIESGATLEETATATGRKSSTVWMQARQAREVGLLSPESEFQSWVKVCP